MANGYGGKRAGAGRKPRAERFATAIQRSEKRIADRLPDIIDRLFELADGVEVQDKERVYSTPPDFRAASYLIDRILGKPTQAVEAQITGKDGGPVRYSYEELKQLPPDELIRLHRETLEAEGED